METRQTLYYVVTNTISEVHRAYIWFWFSGYIVHAAVTLVRHVCKRLIAMVQWTKVPASPTPSRGGGGVLHHEVGGVLGPEKKLGPNGSDKQLLKWGSMGEMGWQGQGLNKAQLCTWVYVCGAPHAAGLNELCCSLALIPTTEDMILRMQVQGYAGATIFRVNGRDCFQS